MQRTSKFKLEHMVHGAQYSASADRRRFMTIDYNMATLAGLVGNGILSGWSVEQGLAPLEVVITPGTGIINGKYSESAYIVDGDGVPKRKSQAIADGDTITVEIPGWSNPNAETSSGSYYRPASMHYLDGLRKTGEGPGGEDNDLDGVAEGVLYPRLVPHDDSFWDDPFVKAYDTGERTIELPGDGDNYIYAVRNSDDSFDTFVSFTTELDMNYSSSYLLLAVVVTRGGSIYKIDTSKTRYISSETGLVEELGADSLKKHIHGGDKPYDPPHIRLNTDIRNGGLWQFDPATNRAVYAFLPSAETSTEAEHKHSLFVDANGNGYTTSTTGDVDNHYHDIIEWVVQPPVLPYQSLLATHSHTINQEADSWDEEDEIRVSVNGVEIDAAKYSVSHLNNGIKTIVFNQAAVNVIAPTYSVSFKIDDTRTYSFSSQLFGVRSFILSMLTDFSNKFRDEYNPEDGNNTIRNPFDFYQDRDGNNVEHVSGKFYKSDIVPITDDPTSTTEVSESSVSLLGFQEAFSKQAQTAAATLKKKGDKFTLLPNLAKYIEITLEDEGHIDEIKVEILKNCEVTGVLPLDNILFVDAAKFTSGIFDPVHVPFLDHLGRFFTVSKPMLLGSSSANGIKYDVCQKETMESFGHTHRISMDTNGNGSTIATKINGQLAVYVEKEDELIRITHSHTIDDALETNAVAAVGVNNWQDAGAGDTHSHEIESSSLGTCCSFFDVTQFASKTFSATSRGILLKTDDTMETCVVAIDGIPFNCADTTLSACLEQARDRFFKATGKLIELVDVQETETFQKTYALVTFIDPTFNTYAYGEIATPYRVSIEIEKKTWIDDPDSVSFYFSATPPVEEYDSVFVKMSGVPFSTAIGMVPGLSSVIPPETEDDVTTTPVYCIKRDIGLMTPARIESDENENMAVIMDRTRVFVKRSGETWNELQIAASGIVKDIMFDTSGNLWVCSSAGTFVARTNEPSIAVKSPLDVPSICAVETVQGTILISTEDAVWISTDGGVQFSELLDSSFINMDIDYRFVRTTEDDSHSHLVILDSAKNGFALAPVSYTPSHTHLVSDGDILFSSGHDHAGLVFKIVARTADGAIWTSEDSGTTWTASGGYVPAGLKDKGYLCPFNDNLVFGIGKEIYSSTDDGLTWTKTNIASYVNGFSYSTDGLSVSILSDNSCYLSDNGTSFSEDSTRTIPGGARPIVFVNKLEIKSGWTYNNRSNAIIFQNLVEESQVECSASASVFEVDGGPWSTTSKYEVFIDGDIVLSTVKGTDKRSEVGSFTVYPESGRIVFDTKEVVSGIAVDRKTVYIKDSSIFSANDPIAIDYIDSSGKKAVQLATVESVGSGYITTYERMYFKYSSITRIRNLSPVPSTSDVRITIYESPIINAGSFDHYKVEDTMSQHSDGVALGMSDLLTGNLGRLINSIKYAVPAIDEYARNWKSYMMRFSADSLDPAYIENYFDTETTNLLGSISLASPFSPLMSKNVTAVAIGYGDFSNYVFAGTDTGLYVAKAEDIMEATWFLVQACPAGAVNDMFLLPDKIVVCGKNGIYVSDETLENWTQIDLGTKTTKEAIMARPRWTGTDGDEWWNNWEQGGKNLTNPELTNTIVVGLAGGVITSNNNGVSWSGSIVNAGGDYRPVDMIDLNDGSAVLAINNSTTDSISSSKLLSTTESGLNWSKEDYVFRPLNATITKRLINGNGNTKLNIRHNTPDSNLIPDGQLSGKTVHLGTHKATVIYNTKTEIVLYGGDSYEFATGTITSESVQLSSIAAISPVKGGPAHILAATDTGIFGDAGYHSAYFGGVCIGQIAMVGKSATVDSVDVSARILEVQSSLVGGQTTLICQTDVPVFTNDLAGGKFILSGSSAPSVEITTPEANDTLLSGTITTSITVDSFVTTSGYIAYKIDSNDIVYSRETSHEFTDVGSGRHTISVFLTDENKTPFLNEESKSFVSFTVLSNANDASVQITSPLTGQTVRKSSVTVTGTVTGIDSITYYGIGYRVNSGAYTEIPFSSGVFSFTASNLTSGSNSIVVALLDKEGAPTAVLDSISLNVVVSTQPSIVITAPYAGSVVGSSSLAIVYDISNFSVPGNGRVMVKLDSQPAIYSDSQFGVEITGVSNGSHTVVVTLVDLQNNPVSNATASCSFSVDSQLSSSPSVSITSPASGTTYSPGGTVDLSFIANNFEIPGDGGVLISVNSAPAVFWQSLSAYKINITNNGTYSVSVRLATNASTPVGNQDALDTTTFVVTGTPSASTAATGGNTQTAQQPTTTTTVSTTTTTTTQGHHGQWDIVSNGSTDSDFIFSIQVKGTIGSSVVGLTGRASGQNSILYVTFDTNVKSQEFNEGKFFLSEDSESPVYFGISTNSRTKIWCNSSLPSYVKKGTKISLLDSSGTVTVYLTWLSEFGVNDISGCYVETRGSSTARWMCRENNPFAITLEVGSNTSLPSRGDSVFSVNSIYSHIHPFNHAKTSSVCGHTHPVSLIGRILRGSVVSLAPISATTVRLGVEGDGFPNALLDSNPDLLEGCSIFIANSSRVWEKKIQANPSGYIDVLIDTEDDFDLFDSDPLLIRPGCVFAIDARMWGVTGEAEFDIPISAPHTHFIRRGEVEPEDVYDILFSGLANPHKHILEPVMSGIQDITVMYDNMILVAGGSSSIYASSTLGESWYEYLDTTLVLEGAETPSAITFLAAPYDRIIAGTDKGYLIVQEEQDIQGSNVGTNEPFGGLAMQGSSSSSSVSSLSSGSSDSSTSISSKSSSMTSVSSSSSLP